MKINDKVLSLPPYISTSWSQVTSILFKNGALVVNLRNADSVTIPGLSPQILDQIFAAHAAYTENEAQKNTLDSGLIGGSPFKIGFSTTDGLGAALQHNPEQAGAPDLPPQMLEKLGAIAKIIAPEDIENLPLPESNCNCMHCQIARAIQTSLHAPTDQPHIHHEQEGELVSDAELQFPEWDITQTGDNLFSVVNHLDQSEKYNVFLGHPVGCTCGKAGCEHILAVLKS